jgi:hypothetical protein
VKPHQNMQSKFKLKGGTEKEPPKRPHSDPDNVSAPKLEVRTLRSYWRCSISNMISVKANIVTITYSWSFWSRYTWWLTVRLC